MNIQTAAPSLPYLTFYSPILPFTLPLTLIPAPDLYPTLRTSLFNSLSRSWPLLPTHPHIHRLFSEVPSSLPPPLPNRFLNVIKNRILLGHTRFSHGHLMSRDPPSPCPFCSTPASVSINHVVFSCPSLTPLRRSHMSTLPLTDPYTVLSTLLFYLPTHSRIHLLLWPPP